MATRSAIGMEVDGKIVAIYCHWDGYIENNGELLYRHYRNPEKILKLISFGDLSSLGEEIGEKHEFNTRHINWCTYYGRDHGKDDVESKSFSTREEMIDWYEGSEYFYLWTNKHWIYSDGKVWRELEQALASIDSEDAA